MNEFNKLLALLFVISLSVTVNVLVLAYGWNLTPHSWWWIIGGGVFARIVLDGMYRAIVADESKKGPRT
jgi:hypothetical protein